MPALSEAEGPALSEAEGPALAAGASSSTFRDIPRTRYVGGMPGDQGSEGQPAMRLLVLTPDRVALDEQVVSIRFQQPDGWQGILAHHAPYLTRLVDGVMMYRLAQDPQRTDSSPPHYLVLYGGTLQVKGDEVVVLTTAAEPGRTLEELRQRLAEHQAEADALAFDAYIEFTRVRAALVRALTDLPEAPKAIR
jgi:F-type H+-transporting ATPase subunit epsilon